MTIIPYEEADNLISGDIVYRYEDTLVFYAHDTRPSALKPGWTDVILDGEEVHLTVAALIEGPNFRVYWHLEEVPAETAVATGYLMKSETTARRLFPNLADYRFVNSDDPKTR